MKDNRHLLKIKLKSLAAEAKIIRREEQKRKLPVVRDTDVNLGDYHELMAAAPEGEARTKAVAKALRIAKAKRRAELRAKPWFTQNQSELVSLHEHRTMELRLASRATGLAYGFLKGLTLDQMELRVADIERPYTLPGDVRVTLREANTFQEAAKLVKRYGVGGSTDKIEAERDFFRWVKQRNVVRFDDAGVPRLRLAPLDGGSNARDDLLGASTDNITTDTQLQDVPQLDVLHLGNTGRSPAEEAGNDQAAKS
jgi:hypothetical protein